MRSEQRFRGALKCVRSSCRIRWFAEPIEAGSVRGQLEEAYQDPQIATDLMARFNLPDTIDTPMYLQIPITIELWADYSSDQITKPRSKTIRLLRQFLLTVHRRAS
jgi:hypothetical protein